MSLLLDRCVWADPHILSVFTLSLSPVVYKGALIFLKTERDGTGFKKPTHGQNKFYTSKILNLNKAVVLNVSTKDNLLPKAVNCF